MSASASVGLCATCKTFSSFHSRDYNPRQSADHTPNLGRPVPAAGGQAEETTKIDFAKGERIRQEIASVEVPP